MRAFSGILEGSIVFEPAWRRDEQGLPVWFSDAEIARAAGLDARGLVQESRTRIPRGAVRVIHLQTDGGEGQLVRCVSGAVVDVSVDLRPASPTYRLWMTLVLDDGDHRSVWLPAGLAHGFQALTSTADVRCRVKRIHQPDCEVTIRHDDPDLAIPWPLPVTELSAHDEAAPDLAVAEPKLGAWFGVPQ